MYIQFRKPHWIPATKICERIEIQAFYVYTVCIYTYVNIYICVYINMYIYMCIYILSSIHQQTLWIKTISVKSLILHQPCGKLTMSLVIVWSPFCDPALLPVSGQTPRKHMGRPCVISKKPLSHWDLDCLFMGLFLDGYFFQRYQATTTKCSWISSWWLQPIWIY